ncbi:MAG TPA: SPFH and helix-turn-helix domain-containing protein, partial [Solirubrobacterales bacterium]|nr:SPFH and helix-turn-helix domain-containing protein [Solirubrobacterales bacterium]
IASFVVENISVPAEVEQAIDKRTSMAAVGNLNDYVKFQMAQGMEKGGTGAGGLATEMAVGFAIAQQFVQQQAGALQGAAAPGAAAGPAAGPALPDLMTPAQVAQALGVSEADVLAIIQANELKAKKIGSSHRIRRQDLDTYLAS